MFWDERVLGWCVSNYGSRDGTFVQVPLLCISIILSISSTHHGVILRSLIPTRKQISKQATFQKESHTSTQFYFRSAKPNGSFTLITLIIYTKSGVVVITANSGGNVGVFLHDPFV